jgi:hypothetical protein
MSQPAWNQGDGPEQLNQAATPRVECVGGISRRATANVSARPRGREPVDRAGALELSGQCSRSRYPEWVGFFFPNVGDA